MKKHLRNLPKDVQDLLILIMSVLITWGLCQLPVIDNMHKVPPAYNEYIEWQQNQWNPACPYCGKPLKEKE